MLVELGHERTQVVAGNNIFNQSIISYQQSPSYRSDPQCKLVEIMEE